MKSLPVVAIPLDRDGIVMEHWPVVGHATSVTGAIKVCRDAGYKVVLRGGIAERGFVPPDDDNIAWLVTVKGE